MNHKMQMQVPIQNLISAQTHEYFINRKSREICHEAQQSGTGIGENLQSFL